jgi:hypothetical protein
MNNPTTWLWHLRRWLRLSGTLGWLGLAMAALALWITLFEALPMSRDITRRERIMAAAQQQLQHEDADSPVPKADTVKASEERLIDVLRKMHANAERYGLAIPKSDYAVQPEADGHLQRYTVQISIDADYPRIRRFWMDAEEMPGVRIENLALQRRDISDAQVSAQLRLSYLVEVAR